MASGALLASLGLVLTSVSGPSCGCDEPWMLFLYEFGVADSESFGNLDGAVMTQAAQKHLIGQPLSKIEFPEKIHASNCLKQTKEALDCEYWFLSGPLRERGFHVVMNADSTGLIRSVKVTDMQVVLGRWRFGS